MISEQSSLAMFGTIAFCPSVIRQGIAIGHHVAHLDGRVTVDPSDQSAISVAAWIAMVPAHWRTVAELAVHAAFGEFYRTPMRGQQTLDMMASRLAFHCVRIAELSEAMDRGPSVPFDQWLGGEKSGDRK